MGIYDNYDYVTSGLTQHFDGEFNGGLGHVSATRVWKDLVGNSDANLSEEVRWTRNSAMFSGQPSIITFDSIVTNRYTIMVTFNPVYLTGQTHSRMFGENPFPTLFTHTTSSRAYGFYAQGKDQTFPGLTIPEQGQVNHAAIRFTGTHVQLFVNGVFDSEIATSTNPPLTTVTATMGNRVSGAARQFSGKIHNFMVYDRNLSDGEILNNAEIDLERFGEDPLGRSVQLKNENEHIFPLVKGEDLIGFIPTIGNLDDLKTSDISNVVSAINEIVTRLEALE